MKLIPFLRFGDDRGEEEGDNVVDPLSDLPELPTDEQTEQVEDEETTTEEEETEEGEERSSANDDEMLKMFMAVDEEIVDNSGLSSQLEDVPADELLQELRVIASAFGIRVAVSEDEAA